MKNNEKFTEKAEGAIEQARLAAFGLGHSYVGTEHLLLGILRERAGLGARILRDRGLSEHGLKDAISRANGTGEPGVPTQGLTKFGKPRLLDRALGLFGEFLVVLQSFVPPWVS